MRKLWITCLSLVLGGCISLPAKPDGWLCSFRFDTQTFYCNRIANPKQAQDFHISDPLFRGAECMDLDTFKAYTDYVYELKKRLISCEGK